MEIIKRCCTCKSAHTLGQSTIRCRVKDRLFSAFTEACPHYAGDVKKEARGWGLLKRLADKKTKEGDA